MVSPTFSSPPSVKTVNRPLSLAVPFSSLNFTQTTDGNFTTPNVLATAPLSSSARAYPNAALFFRPTLNFTATEASQERFEDVFDPDTIQKKVSVWYIAMYGQTVRAERIVPSGTSMGNQGGGTW